LSAVLRRVSLCRHLSSDFTCETNARLEMCLIRQSLTAADIDSAEIYFRERRVVVQPLHTVGEEYWEGREGIKILTDPQPRDVTILYLCYLVVLLLSQGSVQLEFRCVPERVHFTAVKVGPVDWSVARDQDTGASSRNW